MSRTNAKGRSRYDHHVRLYDWLMRSEAWQAASGNEIKGLIYIASFDFGDNNGRIHMSQRRLAEGIGVDTKTAHRILAGLQEKGFIACTAKGSFKAKRSPASTWRLTWKPWPDRSQGPSHEYRRWTEISRREQFPVTEGKIPQTGNGGASTEGSSPLNDQQDRRTSVIPPSGKSPPLTLAIGEGAPVEPTRVQLSDWWRTSEPKDHRDLARRLGLPVNTLLDFLSGDDLCSIELDALRAELKTDRRAA